VAAHTFYEGNDATKDNLGSISATPGVNYDLKASGAPIQNDEARSVVIGKGVQAGAALAVYDSPNASMSDDWCVIQVKTTITAPGGHTVGTFESDTNDDTIYTDYHKDDGLDGKVSYISIYDPWPVPMNEATKLLDASSNDYEPSGLTLVGDSLYMVSDNGKLSLCSPSATPTRWPSQTLCTPTDDTHPKSFPYGFESIDYVKGKLMLGVEGADNARNQRYPMILRFDQTATTTSHPLGQLTGSQWILEIDKLDDNAGMEAMTFVPDAFCPSSWGSSTHYGGLFLVAVQSRPGKIYVYDLPKGSRKSHTIKSYRTSFTTGLSKLELSDMCFDNGTLYVLYDDKIDVLTTLTLSKSGVSFKNQTMPPIWPSSMPQGGSPVKNCEGVAVRGSTLYLGLDQNSSSLRNYVFQFNDFALTR